MYRRILNIFALCVLAAVAAATWYWSRPTPPAEPAAALDDERPPSYYLRDALIRRMDDEGRVLYRVYAEFAEERPEERALLLERVRVEYRETEEIPWQIEAGRALVYFDAQTLELEGGVELARDSAARGMPASVRTEQLRLEPQRRVAIADGEVSFTFGGSTLTATGLMAYLDEDRLELRSNVQGRFTR